MQPNTLIAEPPVIPDPSARHIQYQFDALMRPDAHSLHARLIANGWTFCRSTQLGYTWRKGGWMCRVAYSGGVWFFRMPVGG